MKCITKGLLKYDGDLPYAKKLTIASSSRMGKVEYVSDVINGPALYKHCYNKGYTSEVVTFLVGVFVGRELVPRFLLFREANKLYYYYEGVNRFLVPSPEYVNEALFDEGVQSDVRLWRLRG